jgi:hypothetical protein
MSDLWAALLGATLVSALALACSADVKSVESADSTDPGSCFGRDGDADDSFRCTRPTFELGKEVDILFVVDDASIAPQARLAAAMTRFVEAVREAEPDADLRIGVTSTDDGNPACDLPLGSGGALDATSCRSREDAFGSPEAFTTGCSDHCTLETLELLPTSTEHDPEPRVRPWIEVAPFAGNLPEGVDLAEALACVIPRGNRGCPLRAPLSALIRAAERTRDSSDPAHGFVRTMSSRIVVLVTAGLECSVNPEGASAFDPEGPRALWSDPEAEAPTQAACWNAGVACEGEDTWSCEPFDRYPDGGDASVIRYASLRPIESLARAAYTAWTSHRPTRYFVLAGLPSSGSAGDGSVPYAPADDPAHALELGVAPACVLADTAVPPPVRMLEFGDMRSICEDDYSGHALELAAIVDELLPPLCVHACVADVDEAAPGLQTDCELERQWVGDDGFERGIVPRCLPGDSVPEGEVLCWSPRTGDQLSPACAEYGWNLEVAVTRNGPVDGSMSYRCTLSTDPRRDCFD